MENWLIKNDHKARGKITTTIKKGTGKCGKACFSGKYVKSLCMNDTVIQMSSFFHFHKLEVVLPSWFAGVSCF